MIAFTIDKSTKRFFDKPFVKSKIEKMERRVLSRVGAVVRGKMRSLVRPARKVRPPGKPIRSVTGLVRRFIFFNYNEISKSVTIAPARFPDKKEDLIHILEHGGTVYRTIKKGSTDRPYFVRQAIVIRPHPFVSTAFNQTKKLTEGFLNQL